MYLMLSLQPFTQRALIVLCLPIAALAATEVRGVNNFHQVNEQVYRGAQPTNEGFTNLARLGITPVVDLREPGDRSLAESQVVKAAGMRYISVPMKGLSAPSAEDVAKVLNILSDPAAG